MGDDTSVRVAVRIRPQIPREVIDMCRICTSVTPGEPQVWLGNDKAFTYDFVFDTNTFQAQVYEACVKTLIEGCFEGYNATVLAYGQTGSGKTYTMGTGFDMNVTEDEVGIIPRAVNQLFEGIEDRRQQSIANSEQPPEFKIVCQFMELYNEEVIDLFDTTRDALSRGRKSNIKIHEDSTGAIYTAGLTSKIVTTKLETMQCLKLGALSRTTASTQMNVQSSRSHAIFTLHIMQQRLVKCKDPDSDTNEMSEFETLTAKFHFVDLAGSERLKRTGATGERAKEGISINCGLLALGNVISALGDKTKRGHHVPYRDSKLTRLLQDSLGGNSRTVMIACISPSDRDFMETLNTLKYANRARNIKNRVTVNQDKTSKTISALRMEIQQLQLELMEYKQGKRLIVDGVESVNDMYHENTMLQSENNNLRTRIKAMQETVDQLTARNTQLLAEKSIGSWINSDDGSNSDISQVIKGYLKEIEELRAKLLESENTCQILRRTATKVHGRTSLTAQPSSSSFDLSFGADETEIVDEILEEAKLNLVRLKRKEKHTKIKNSVSEKENAENDEKAEGDEKKDQNSEDEDNMEEITEDDASSSDTDSEENNKYEEDLAELTCEISIKQKLIEELELSQRRLQTMRQQYEEKLLQLQNKIRATQEERDKVLSNLETRGNQTEDKAKKVKDEYEKKINNLQSELKKLQAAKKEHARLVKSQSQYEHQLKTLRNELTEMKKTKVRLINKMKEESAKHKEEESRRNREIAQLKKESRKRENQIRTLEADKRLKETVLRRKQEEVIALRRQNKPMSDKVAGRVPRPKTAPAKSNIYRKLNAFSPKLAKQKWQKVEKEIHKLALSRQAVANVEKDMERWLKEREKLTRDMEKSLKKRDKAIVDRMDEAVIKDLEDYIENLKTNIDYVQENITDCQTNIVQMEETKDNEIFDPTALTSVEELEEAKYLLEKLITFAINQGIAVAQKEAGMKELEAEMNQVVQNNSLHQQLLQHLLAQTDMDIYNYMVMNDNVANVPSTESSRSNSPVESSSSTAFEFPVVPSPSSESIGRSSMRDKARRRTATPQELLFAGKEGPPLGLSIPSIVEDQTRSCNIELISNNNHDENCNSNGIPRVPSAPGSLKAIVTGKIEINSRFSPIMGRKTYERPLPDVSPRLPRKFTLHSSTSNLFLSRQSSIDNSSDVTPPTSPTTTRRSRDDNVFSRLTSHSSLNSETNPNRGEIIPFSGKMKPAPLVCTHVAEGHSKAVLTVAATENLLFSGAKDRTVKIWDLNKGMEIQSLEGFPNNVCVVRYAETSSQVFTVSSSFIKVWDIRENPAKCMRTLSSSGLTTNGSTMLGHFVSRTLQMPPGEIQINDIALNRQGTVLFSAAGSAVRIWDLRKFQCIGRLSGGHQAAVMCLAVEELDKSNNIVITGSKDHYIKVFEVTEGIGGMHTPKLNLEPPHYDGIQSLAVTGSYLFSGSRDMCIKKWDLKENILKQSLNQAHKDWICGLSIIPGGQILLSGCRGGYMKLWSVENCIQLGEIRAHASPINAITTNSSAVFSASSDGTIGMWRLKMSNDVSPELSDAN